MYSYPHQTGEQHENQPTPQQKTGAKDRVWSFEFSMTLVGEQGSHPVLQAKKVSQQGCRVQDRANSIGAPCRQLETTRLDVSVRHYRYSDKLRGKGGC